MKKPGAKSAAGLQKIVGLGGSTLLKMPNLPLHRKVLLLAGFSDTTG